VIKPLTRDPGTVPAAPRRIPARTRLDFCLDATIFAAFLVAYSFGLTGVAIHEWLGIALGLVLVVHLTVHWDWVLRTTRRLLRKGGPDRVIWLVNLLLIVTMTLCVASGILISWVALPELGIDVADNGFWAGLHGTTFSGGQRRQRCHCRRFGDSLRRSTAHAARPGDAGRRSDPDSGGRKSGTMPSLQGPRLPR